MTNNSYPNIDMKRTGMLLKSKIRQAGYSVKDIQEKLFLSCPQPIYRWFNGTVLPSVNHLYVLSRLLNVHMEELLVPEFAWEGAQYIDTLSPTEKRLMLYWEKIQKIAWIFIIIILKMIIGKMQDLIEKMVRCIVRKLVGVIFIGLW